MQSCPSQMGNYGGNYGGNPKSCPKSMICSSHHEKSGYWVYSSPSSSKNRPCLFLIDRDHTLVSTFQPTSLTLIDSPPLWYFINRFFQSLSTNPSTQASHSYRHSRTDIPQWYPRGYSIDRGTQLNRDVCRAVCTQ